MKKTIILAGAFLLFSFASFAILPIGGATGACIGDSTAVGDSTHGGVWTSSNTSVATIVATLTPHLAYIHGISAGTAIISYNVSGVYATMTITVSPAPAPITGTTTICAGSTTTLSDPTPGGTWSSSTTSYATVGMTTGIVTGIIYGADILYNIAPGCAARVFVTVNTTSAGYIHGDSSVCVGSTSSKISDATPGGIWTSGNTSIATVGSTTGIVTGISSGSAMITYTVTDPCGTASAHTPVYVTSTTMTGTITPTITYVGKSYYVNLTGGLWGGTFTSSNPAVATINPLSGLITGVSVGTTMITYTLTGCGGTAFTTALFNVIPLNSISGHVLFTGTPYSGPLKIYLITYNPGTYDLKAIDSVYSYQSGVSSAYYEFIGAATDSFRIKAAGKDTSTIFTGYMPTYHTSNFYWHSANVLYHMSGTSDTSNDITMAYGIVPAGPGFIGGYVTSGANKGTGGTGPVAGLRMFLVDAATSTMVQQVKTDATGNYTFTNLPVGATYYVHPEADGYLTTPYTSISLTSSAPSMTAAIFVQHTVSHTITPVPAAIGLIKPLTSSVFVFPNPSNGKLNLHWTVNENETGNFTITDVAGRNIYNTTVKMTQGTGNSPVDLTGLSNGLYLINVKSETVNYNDKMQIRK